MKKITVLSLCAGLLLFSFVPCFSAGLSGFSADQEPSDACIAAIKDAKNEVQGIVWMGAGCLLNGIGLLAAYIIQSNPPSDRFIGKSASYVSDYTKCYHKRADSIRLDNAWTGFYWSFTVYAAIIGVILWAGWMNTVASF